MLRKILAWLFASPQVDIHYLERSKRRAQQLYDQLVHRY